MTKVKTDRKLATQNNIIKALNFDYSGPIDGHDLPKILSELERLKEVKGPKFLHIITTKGKGLQQAEEDQVTYHAPGKFDKISGERIPKKESIYTNIKMFLGKQSSNWLRKMKKLWELPLPC